MQATVSVASTERLTEDRKCLCPQWLGAIRCASGRGRKKRQKRIFFLVDIAFRMAYRHFVKRKR